MTPLSPIETILKIEALRDEANDRYYAQRNPNAQQREYGKVLAFTECLTILKEMRVKGDGMG